MAARKGAKAYDDLAGGYCAPVWPPMTTGVSWYRNAYLWDIE